MNPITIASRLAAALALAATVQASAAPAACTPVCITCAPVCQPQPKPAPKPCNLDPLAELRAMPAQALPADPRALILEAMRLGAPFERFQTANGRVIMRNRQELIELRLPGGQAVAADLIGSGDVYRAAGWYVLRPAGCRPLLLATNAADPARLIAQAGQTAGMGLRLPTLPGQAATPPTTTDVQPVPEPGTLLLVIAALAVWLSVRGTSGFSTGNEG